MPMSVGGVVSETLTRNDPLSCNPPLSVTEHWTVVMPITKVEPEVGAHVGVGGGTSSASLALAVHETVAPAGEVASAERSPGKWSVGGVLPTTLTWNVIAVLPVRPVAPRRDQSIVKR